MTNEMMQLQRLLEKSADADVLRKMIGFASQRLMELEVPPAPERAPGRRIPSALAEATALLVPSREGPHAAALRDSRREIRLRT